MKKYFVLMAACALALSLFVACQSPEAETDAKTEADTIVDTEGNDETRVIDIIIDDGDVDWDPDYEEYSYTSEHELGGIPLE